MLTGGHNAGIPDSGTITATVNGTNYQVSFGSGDTGTSIASRLATAMNGSTVVTAVASGSQVNLTSKSAGASGNATLSASYTWNNGLFSQASFTASTLGVAGGYDAGVIDNNPFKTSYSYDTLGNLTCVEQHGSATTGTGCSAAPGNDATSPWRVRRFTYDSLSRLLTAKNPESGTITYLYDNDGELLQKTSPAPNQTGTATQAVSFCYDELHRPTKRDYSVHTFSPPACPITTPIVSYVYDSGTNGKGHLTSLTDQPGTATYSYDILGRLITETRSLKGANNAAISKTISYTYNLDGSVKTLTYPSNKVITYAPDSAGRMLSAVDSASGINYITGATYGPDSALTGFISGSGGAAAITNAFSYNKRLQPVAMSASTASQTLFSIGYDFHLGSGDNGNVFGITNNKDTTRNQTFTYDQLNRLVSAQNAGTDCNVNVLGSKKKFWGNSYGYDAWGNLLSKTVTKCSSEALSVVAGNDNRLQGAYTYDAAGNMLHDANSGLNYTWDQENRLTGANGFTYTYDADGNRVRKSNGNLAANGTLYWYMTPGVVAETDLAGTTKSEYIFFDGERVARRDGATGAGGVFYYFSDHLKTASVITDSAGVIKAESDYYPWGGELQFVNNDTNDYKFTGKKRDVETGLDYFGARYYSNGLARFVSADWSATPVPVPYAHFDDPQTLNLYRYPSNPETYADLDGHDDWWKTALDFVGSAANAWASDNALGAGRFDSGTTAGKLGAALGDGAATIQGVGETLLGGTGEVVGITLDATGAGAVLGIPVNIASAGLIAHGVTTGLNGGAHLAKSASETSGSSAIKTAEDSQKLQPEQPTGPKAEEAPGVTAGGQATDKYGNKLTGSRKVQINKTKSSTREGARNKALKEGSGAVEHRNPTRGERHWHPTGKDGKKVPGSTHHEY
jgi:RHS repeat-associated protein